MPYDAEARARNEATRVNSINPLQQLYASALIRHEDLKDAAEEIGMSRDQALRSFWNSDFCHMFEMMRKTEIDFNLRRAREIRDFHSLKHNKSTATRYQLNRLDRVINDLLRESYRTVDQIFPELKTILGERWKG